MSRTEGMTSLTCLHAGCRTRLWVQPAFSDEGISFITMESAQVKLKLFGRVINRLDRFLRKTLLTSNPYLKMEHKCLLVFGFILLSHRNHLWEKTHLLAIFAAV